GVRSSTETAEVNSDDLAEVVRPETIHPLFGPPGLAPQTGGAIGRVPSVSVVDSPTSALDRYHRITLDLGSAQHPAERTADHQDHGYQLEQPELQVALPWTGGSSI